MQTVPESAVLIATETVLNYIPYRIPVFFFFSYFFGLWRTYIHLAYLTRVHFLNACIIYFRVFAEVLCFGLAVRCHIWRSTASKKQRSVQTSRGMHSTGWSLRNRTWRTSLERCEMLTTWWNVNDMQLNDCDSDSDVAYRRPETRCRIIDIVSYHVNWNVSSRPKLEPKFKSDRTTHTQKH